MTNSDIKLLRDRAVELLGRTVSEDTAVQWEKKCADILRDLARLRLPEGHATANVIIEQQKWEIAQLRERVEKAEAGCGGEEDRVQIRRSDYEELLRRAEKPPTKTTDGEDSHLGEHARKLDDEVRQWPERELRSTYSSEHLKDREGDDELRRFVKECDASDYPFATNAERVLEVLARRALGEDA